MEELYKMPQILFVSYYVYLLQYRYKNIGIVSNNIINLTSYRVVASQEHWS